MFCDRNLTPSGLVHAGMSAANSSKTPSVKLIYSTFLCGPRPFMDASRAILTGLGVSPERIMQESFGNSAPRGAKPLAAVAGTDMVVEFARSRQTYTVRNRQTLLEAAQEDRVEHTFILPAGTVWDLQGEAAGRECASGRRRGPRC
jgi:hypothetical protein